MQALDAAEVRPGGSVHSMMMAALECSARFPEGRLLSRIYIILGAFVGTARGVHKRLLEEAENGEAERRLKERKKNSEILHNFA